MRKLRRYVKPVIVWTMVVLLSIDTATACRLFRRRSRCYRPCVPVCAPEPTCCGSYSGSRAPVPHTTNRPDSAPGTTVLTPTIEGAPAEPPVPETTPPLPPKPEAKPAPKPEPKPEAKPEPKPEAKPEPKPEAKPEPKPEAKPKDDLDDLFGKPKDKPADKPADKPKDDTDDLFGKPKDKPADKPKDDADDLFGKPPAKPADKPADKPKDDADDLFGKPPAKPADKPADKPKDDADDLFGKPADKPADKPKDDADDLFGKPKDKPADKPADKPKDDADDLFGKPKDKPADKPADKPKDDADDLFGTPKDKPADKPKDDADDLFGTPAAKPEAKPAAEEKKPAADDLFGTPAAKPEAKPADSADDLFGKPEAKPADKPKDDADDLFGTPAKKPAADDLFGTPAAKPEAKPADSADGADDLFGKPEAKPADKPKEAADDLFGTPAKKPAADDLFGTPAAKPEETKPAAEEKKPDESQTKEFYDRLPAKSEKVVRAPVWGLSRHSSGMYVRFVTDATSISARWTLRSASLAMNHMPATGVSGLDLYVRLDDGRLHWLGTGRPSAKTSQGTLVSGISPGRREYYLYLPLYNGVESVHLGIAKSATLAKASPWPTKRAKPICFYGTSITQGGCASRTGMTYAAILGRRLNRPTINLGFSGNGKMDLEVAQLLAELDVAVYVINCLPNMSAGEVAERTEPLVRTIRKARPQTPIVLAEDRTYANAVLLPRSQERHKTSRAALRKAYDRLISSGVKNLHYMTGETQLGADGEDTVDGSHPTDLGFVRMSDAFMPVLKPLLTP